ncbi:MAG: leucine-rich repeat domain-containing protein [Alphaproteobacteria bacterium]|nr:leucine-rich repeat domain-containing protein [Alphaproteobacteria bacterium]
MKMCRIYFLLFLFIFFSTSSYAENLSNAEKETRIDAFIESLQADNPSKKFDAIKHDIIITNKLNIIHSKISHETLKKLSDLIWLKNLNIPENQLAGLPESFGNLTNLTGLDLHNNQLISLPESFGNLIKLKTLRLSRTELTSLPNSLGNLTQLTSLNLSNNQLQNLPDSFDNLKQLTSLNLSDNQFQNLPDSFDNLKQLTSLNLSDNQLQNLPDSFDNLKQLTSLDLSDNQFEKLPESFSNLIKLKILDLSNNKFEKLPESFSNLIKLYTLYLSDNQLQNLPALFADLRNSIQLIDLTRNPLQPRGLGNVLGEEDLHRIFGDRVILPRLGKKRYKMIPITEAALYEKLDATEIAVNRETIKDYRMPDVPDLGWDVLTFMKNWQSLLGLLILEDPEENRIKKIDLGERTETEKNYMSKAISYELLANDFNNPYLDLSNRQKIEQYIFPRLNGFLKTIWELPLEKNEKSGWQMYEGSLPALKRNLSYIVSRMIDENLDADSRHVLMSQLSNALFHCPTGQKEGIEVIILSLMTELKGESLTDKIFELLAREKNLLFKSTIMPGNSGQNVHILSVYFERLKDILGLTGYFEHFEEKIGAMGQDPFKGSLGNALEVFYAKFNPDYLVQFILNHIENDVDFELRQTYLNMIDNSPIDPEDMNKVETYIKQAQKERPLLIGNLSNYLSAMGIIKTKDGLTNLGWENYFESDPMGATYPKFKINGIKKILIQMKVLKQKEEDDSSSSTVSSSSSSRDMAE